MIATAGIGINELASLLLLPLVALPRGPNQEVTGSLLTALSRPVLHHLLLAQPLLMPQPTLPSDSSSAPAPFAKHSHDHLKMVALVQKAPRLAPWLDILRLTVHAWPRPQLEYLLLACLKS